MKPMTGRQLLAITVFITSTTALLAHMTTGGDWPSTLLTIPLVASASFWSLRISQRIAMRYGPRYAARDAQPPAQRAQPTTERPDHVRRRREQRRPRGRRRPE